MRLIVYIARMKDGRLYVGHTTDEALRTNYHKSGKGGRTTRIWGFKEIIFTENHATRVSAIRRERQLKGWTRAKKLALARGDLKGLKHLARSRSVSPKRIAKQQA